MCDILFLMTTLSLHLATINLRQDFAITNTYNEQRKKGIRCMKHYLWFMKILNVMNKITWLFTQKSLGSSNHLYSDVYIKTPTFQIGLRLDILFWK